MRYTLKEALIIFENIVEYTLSGGDYDIWETFIENISSSFIVGKLPNPKVFVSTYDVLFALNVPAGLIVDSLRDVEGESLLPVSYRDAKFILRELCDELVDWDDLSMCMAVKVFKRDFYEVLTSQKIKMPSMEN
jgi:hypothetical protein